MLWKEVLGGLFVKLDNIFMLMHKRHFVQTRYDYQRTISKCPNDTLLSHPHISPFAFVESDREQPVLVF